MSVQIAETTGTALADPSAYNAFEAFGDSGSALVGDLLKFSKGDWTAGQEARDVAGLEVVVNMESVKVGWQRWENGKPAEEAMVTVMSGQPQPRRGDLGYVNETEWEVDEDGKPQDPWQETYMFHAKTPDGAEEFTFSSSSAGGRNAVKALCAQFGRIGMREKGGAYPIVKLEGSSYKHDKYGKIFVPVFEVTGWHDGTAEASEEAPAASKKTKF